MTMTYVDTETRGGGGVLKLRLPFLLVFLHLIPVTRFLSFLEGSWFLCFCFKRRVFPFIFRTIVCSYQLIQVYPIGSGTGGDLCWLLESFLGEPRCLTAEHPDTLVGPSLSRCGPVLIVRSQGPRHPMRREAAAWLPDCAPT